MEIERAAVPAVLPRIAITYCKQCQWMLRAAWFAQELLSTFDNSIGEIALIPATGGIFQVHLTYKHKTADGEASQNAQEFLIWDRKAEGGFPEAKILKQKVRNHIEPEKNLGHSDTPLPKVNPNGRKGKASSAQSDPFEGKQALQATDQATPAATAHGSGECENCK